MESSSGFVIKRPSGIIAEGEKILTKEPLRTRIQESSDLIIPIVTTIITLITTFFIKPL